MVENSPNQVINFGSGVHLQPSKDGKREVNNDEAPTLDCAKDPGLLEVFSQTFSFVTIWLLFPREIGITIC